MTISGIAHVNIRTQDIAATVRFYTEILGLAYDGPNVVDGFERHWLRDGQGRAILHLRELAPTAEGTGAVDHVALACEGKATMLARMTAAGVAYAARDDPADGVTQVFVTDPNGVTLELTFPIAAAETQSVRVDS